MEKGPELYSLESYPLGVYFTFEEKDGADGYYIYRKTGEDGEWEKLALSAKSEFFDKSAALNTEYYYSASAYYETGRSSVESDMNETGLYCYFTEYTREVTQSVLDQVGWDLYSAYCWSVQVSYQYIYTGYTTSEAAVNTFATGIGDCVGKAATFCWMARELGYHADVIYGCVPTSSGGISDHAWVEIDYNGTTCVCDPDFESDDGYNGFMIYYGQEGTWQYVIEYIMNDYYYGECLTTDYFYTPCENDLIESYNEDIAENDDGGQDDEDEIISPVYDMVNQTGPDPEILEHPEKFHNKEGRKKRFENAAWEDPYYDGPGLEKPEGKKDPGKGKKDVQVNENQSGDGCVEDGLFW